MLVLPIDRRRTRKLVEENLKIYNRYLLSIADDNQLIIDENTFEIELDIDDKNIFEREKEKIQFIRHVITRYNRLCTLDRKIIYFTYMGLLLINFS
jgi:hypothetical protein